MATSQTIALNIISKHYATSGKDDDMCLGLFVFCFKYAIWDAAHSPAISETDILAHYRAIVREGMCCGGRGVVGGWPRTRWRKRAHDTLSSFFARFSHISMCAPTAMIGAHIRYCVFQLGKVNDHLNRVSQAKPKLTKMASVRGKKGSKQGLCLKK